MKKVALVAVLALAPAVALAADIKGKWLTEEGKGQVVFEKCGAKICGRIVWLRNPLDDKTGKAQLDVLNKDPNLRTRPVLGLRIGEIDSDGSGGWRGLLYNPADGKIYRANLAIQNDGSLVLKGCIMGGALCDAETWTRAN